MRFTGPQILFEHAVDSAAQPVGRDFITMTVIALLSAGMMLLLRFLIGVSTGWSVAAAIAVGAAWGTWRYIPLVNER